jgi:hypothetical protein
MCAYTWTRNVYLGPRAQTKANNKKSQTYCRSTHVYSSTLEYACQTWNPRAVQYCNINTMLAWYTRVRTLLNQNDLVVPVGCVQLRCRSLNINQRRGTSASTAQSTWRRHAGGGRPSIAMQSSAVPLRYCSRRRYIDSSAAAHCLPNLPRQATYPARIAQPSMDTRACLLAQPAFCVGLLSLKRAPHQSLAAPPAAVTAKQHGINLPAR